MGFTFELEKSGVEHIMSGSLMCVCACANGNQRGICSVTRCSIICVTVRAKFHSSGHSCHFQTFHTAQNIQGVNLIMSLWHFGTIINKLATLYLYFLHVTYITCWTMCHSVTVSCSALLTLASIFTLAEFSNQVSQCHVWL